MAKTNSSPRYIYFIVIFMGTIGLMDTYLSLIETVVVPDILTEFNISAESFAFWQGIAGLLTFSVFFVGWFADAFGRKKGMLTLILAMGIPAFLIGFASFTFQLFMILYALVITGTLSNLWELPVTEEAKPEKRGLYGGIAVLISLIPIYAIIGDDIADAFGWRWAYGLAVIPMVVLLIMWYFMKEPQRWIDAQESRENGYLKIKTALKSLTRKDLTYIAVASMVYGVWTISFKMGTTWGKYFFEDILGRTDFSTILLIAGVLTMVGAITSGILMDVIGRKITLMIGCTGAIIGFIGTGFTAIHLSPVFYWMIYFFMALVFAWIMVYFAEIFPTEIRSTAVGLNATVVRVSYVIGPMIAAVLLAIFPQMEGFWIVAGLLMIIPIGSLLLKPYETKGKTLEEIQSER